MKKECTKCGIEKDFSEFYNRKGGKYGLRADCKCCVKENVIKWQAENPEKVKEIQTKSSAKWNAINPEKRKEILAKSKTKDEYKAKRNIQLKQRKLDDPLFKLSDNIRCLIRSTIKNSGLQKHSKTQAILGCTFEEFKIHIESQFQDGMTWDNYPEWEYDHIYPVSLAENEEHLIKLNHYTNFQPLWAEDNRRKSNKLPAKFNINNTID